MHHAVEALDRSGTYAGREQRTPETILSWIDAEFGGTSSIDAAAGGIWIARDASGIAGIASFDLRNLPYACLAPWRSREEVGILGPIGVAARARGRGIGTVLVRAALYSLRERGYRYALVPAVPDPLIGFFEKAADARDAGDVAPIGASSRYRTVILASGNGSNFAAVADAARRGDLPLEVVQLIANRASAFALERAAQLRIVGRVVVWDRSAGETRAAYDERVIDAVAETRPDLVLLLGWMHVLPEAFVERFPQTLNVHPAFLPLDPAADTVTMPDGTSLPVFRGARAFDDALAAGAGWSGASVHRVGAAVDRGELFARLPLRLEPGATRADLEHRLHASERAVLAAAIRSWAARRS